jgi:hypothetical protein
LLRQRAPLIAEAFDTGMEPDVAVVQAAKDATMAAAARRDFKEVIFIVCSVLTFAALGFGLRTRSS